MPTSTLRVDSDLAASPPIRFSRRQYDVQLVARFEQARRSAIGQTHGMGRNHGGQARDATMCVVVRKYRHGAGERDHGAMAGDETKISKRVVSFGSSADD
jgi:hypothetical protein